MLNKATRRICSSAPLFAALGDETRLTLLIKLSDGSLLSISRLAKGSTLTRQAITKHLKVLQEVGLVCSIRHGREKLFQLEPKPLADAGAALKVISQQWDQALARLKAYVED